MAWCDLPMDLLRCISLQLPVVDFLRFSAVCTSWNSALANNAFHRIHRHPSPWLLLPSHDGVDSDTLIFRDLTIEEEDGCHHRFSSLGRYIFGRRCIGSKDGWLVTIDKMELQPHLFNPLTKAEISLPTLFTIPEHQLAIDGSGSHSTYVKRERILIFDKIVVSSNDLSGTAVVIYNLGKLALARPSDQTWVLGPQLPPYHNPQLEWFNDVYFHEEEQMFYAITCFSAVLTFNLNGQNAKLICPAIPIQDPSTINDDCRNYITFLSGTLLKIERVVEFIQKEINKTFTVKTTRISVLKFVSDAASSSRSSSQWISIKDLDGYSLFVGFNHTFSLHHTVAPRIRPNCIYFSNHREYMSPWNVGLDDGLFDLQNDCFQYFLDSGLQPNSPSSIWFTPSLS